MRTAAAPGVLPAIDVRDLSRRFGSFLAVDAVSFDVARSSIFGLLGSNGAGKSTTFRMLCGLLRPSSGSALIDGIDVARDPEAVKRRIGDMSQRFSLYELLTVAQYIDFFGGIYGLGRARLAERRDFVLRMAGLEGRESQLARDLAGGWRQRLALGCALLHEPALLFLDEPTGGVDPLSRRQFWRLIDDLAASGVTVMVMTHYLDEAERFIFPISSMPDALQAVTRLVPARYFLVALRGIVLKGTPLSHLLPQVGALALYATVMLALSSLRLGREASR